MIHSPIVHILPVSMEYSPSTMKQPVLEQQKGWWISVNGNSGDANSQSGMEQAKGGCNQH